MDERINHQVGSLSEQLHAPEQLPDIAGKRLIFTWDQDDSDSIITCGDIRVWREHTVREVYEIYERFEEIAVVLQRKYGQRLKDLAPTPRSLSVLYGDSTSAAFRVESARAQIASGAPKKYNYWELRNAIQENDVRPIRLHLLAGGNPNLADPYTKSTVLHLAARRRQPHIARLLIEAGARLDTLDQAAHSPLAEAIDEPVPKGIPDVPPDRARQSLEIVQMLVEVGASLDGLGRPINQLSAHARWLYDAPLALAARYGNIEVVLYLLEQGAEVDIRKDGGMTPLHHAVLYRQLEAARLLVAAGADVNLSYPPPDFTPLLVALALAYKEEYREHTAAVVRLLAEAGADPNISSADGWSPLIAAVRTGNLELVSLLLSIGADVHHHDRAGNGALHHAVQVVSPAWHQEWQMAPVIETLLAAGADPAVRNHDGKSAREVAREHWATRLEALL
jgi:ankyrin repeat protein